MRSHTPSFFKQLLQSLVYQTGRSYPVETLSLKFLGCFQIRPWPPDFKASTTSYFLSVHPKWRGMLHLPLPV